MERFRYYTEVHRKGDNMKMVTIAVLILSLIIFTGIGEEATEQIILYWAVLMALLVLTNAIFDVQASKKMKQYDLADNQRKETLND